MPAGRSQRSRRTSNGQSPDRFRSNGARGEARRDSPGRRGAARSCCCRIPIPGTGTGRAAATASSIARQQLGLISGIPSNFIRQATGSGRWSLALGDRPCLADSLMRGYASLAASHSEERIEPKFSVSLRSQPQRRRLAADLTLTDRRRREPIGRRTWPCRGRRRGSCGCRRAASSVPNTSTKPSASRSSPSAREPSSPPSITRLAIPMATTAPVASDARPLERGVEHLARRRRRGRRDRWRAPPRRARAGRSRPAPWCGPGRRAASARCVPPPPGKMPSWISGKPRRAESPAHAQVARQRELQPAAEREPVDRGDHRARDRRRARRARRGCPR